MRSVCVVWLCCNFAKCLSVCQFVTCVWVIVPISDSVILCNNDIGLYIPQFLCELLIYVELSFSALMYSTYYLSADKQ